MTDHIPTPKLIPNPPIKIKEITAELSSKRLSIKFLRAVLAIFIINTLSTINIIHIIKLISNDDSEGIVNIMNDDKSLDLLNKSAKVVKPYINPQINPIIITFPITAYVNLSGS